MAQHTFKNGARESVTTVASSEVRASEQSANASSLELLPAARDSRVAAEVLGHAVVAASRNALNASTLLAQFAQNASPLQAALAGLSRAALKTVAAALYSAQVLQPAAAEKFLTHLSLHLIAVDSSVNAASARRLLALVGVEGVGEARELAARALTAANAYEAEFQAQIVAAAVTAGKLVAAEPAQGCSLRARLGYAGPRHQRRATTRRPRAAVRAAEQTLVAVAR